MNQNGIYDFKCVIFIGRGFSSRLGSAVVTDDNDDEDAIEDVRSTPPSKFSINFDQILFIYKGGLC